MNEDHPLVHAFLEAAHCSRWEYRDGAGLEFLRKIEAFIDERIAIAMEARKGRDGETRLDAKHDSAAIAQPSGDHP